MDTTGIPLDKSEFVATVVEGVLYGLSLFMFGATIWVLFARWSIRSVNRAMVVLACLFLLCSTTHFIIDVVRVTEALISNPPEGTNAFLADVSQWTFVAKNYVYAVQTLAGDGVILYRCYVVWQSKLVMVLPLILWCGAVATGIRAAVHASQDPDFDEGLIHWVTAFYSTTFTTNFLTTGLLVWRIWYIDRQTRKAYGRQMSHLRKVLHVVIDAGVIYNVTLVVVWVTFATRTSGQFVVLNMIVPIISITFYMVIIRVGLAARSNESSSPVFPPEYGDPSPSPGNRLQVHISTLTDSKTDGVRRSSMTNPKLSVIDSGNRQGLGGITFAAEEEV